MHNELYIYLLADGNFISNIKYIYVLFVFLFVCFFTVTESSVPIIWSLGTRLSYKAFGLVIATYGEKRNKSIFNA